MCNPILSPQPPNIEECSEEEYFTRRPDVLAAGMSAIAHYTAHGINEGMCNPILSSSPPSVEECTGEEYLTRRPDVRAAGIVAIDHYLAYGINEGMCNPILPPTPIIGNITISAQVGGTPLTIKTCDYDAGAICSLRWKNQEFIDDFDHGRQLQSAMVFNKLGEDYNPTEAGASHLTNGINPSPSSSRLLSSSNNANSLYTKTQMAFWNPVNGQALSNHVMEKWVNIGAFGNLNIIEYKTRFIIPNNENLTFGQVEILTGYMPASFANFLSYNSTTKNFGPLSDGPGEQQLPVVLSTQNEEFAMGIFSGERNMTYGRFRFNSENVVKWNQVTRFSNPAGIHEFTSYVVIGTLEDTRRALEQLSIRFNK